MKKGSFSKTYKCQTRNTEKALDTLAILQERFEQVNGDVANIGKKFDK